jgi:sigma-B regulation protein RsbU (phosphoserine phosphatase)
MHRIVTRSTGLSMLVALLLLLNCGPLSRAQNTAAFLDVSNLNVPHDLDSTWLVHAGDDPAFARPDFDDSQWTAFDPHGSLSKLYGENRPPVVWYRMRVKVNPTQTGLALREVNISRAFEIYVNGERLIVSGSVAPYVPYTSGARLLARIPDQMLSSGSLLIAMRVHIAPSEWGNGQDPGYYANNLTIGQDETLASDDWLSAIGENAMAWLDHLLSVALGAVALVLFAAQRRNAEYLWLAALGLLVLAESSEPFLAVFLNMPFYWEVLTVVVRVATPYLWGSLYLSFVHQRIGWRWRAFFIFAGLTNMLAGLQPYLTTGQSVYQIFTNLPFILLLSVIVPAVLAYHWRRGNREAGILLIPALLFSFYVYAEITFGVLFQIPGHRDFALHWLNLIDRYPAGPFLISLDHISGIIGTIALAIIILLRSSTAIRRQAMLEGELAAAQEVQQVLVPEHTNAVPGFNVESVYEPAQQVGGDFFQILPDGQGGLLVVLGDVAGKGLPAAMLVSVMVGAIRGVAEYTKEPGELLANLNERLVGRAGGGFSTALAAHIAAKGLVTIANAGHLSPYLDGREYQLPGALPLGVLSGAAYESTHFFLAPGSRLTFYSDGVIEAQNRAGELLGFERGRELSTEPAAAIVEAAKRFGQEDDITVVTIERAESVASAA